MNDRAQFCLNQVITATRNLEKLIEDLLSYSRLDTQDQHFTEFSIKEMILNIIKDRQLIIDEYGTTLELKLKNTL
jgi:signal transduction histidine kinase